MSWQSNEKKMWILKEFRFSLPTSFEFVVKNDGHLKCDECLDFGMTLRPDGHHRHHGGSWIHAKVKRTLIFTSIIIWTIFLYSLHEWYHCFNDILQSCSNFFDIYCKVNSNHFSCNHHISSLWTHSLHLSFPPKPQQQAVLCWLNFQPLLSPILDSFHLRE